MSDKCYQDKRLVGRSTPGGPGDIYVSETVIAQIGIVAVCEQVRRIYAAAYAAAYAAKHKEQTP